LQKFLQKLLQNFAEIFYHFREKQTKIFAKQKFCDNTIFIPVNVAPPPLHHGSPAGNIRVNIAQTITVQWFNFEQSKTSYNKKNLFFVILFPKFSSF